MFSTKMSRVYMHVHAHSFALFMESLVPPGFYLSLVPPERLSGSTNN